MKKLFLAVALAGAALMAACQGGRGGEAEDAAADSLGVAGQLQLYADSLQSAGVGAKFSVLVPIGADSVSQQIREGLLRVVHNQLSLLKEGYDAQPDENWMPLDSLAGWGLKQDLSQLFNSWSQERSDLLREMGDDEAAAWELQLDADTVAGSVTPRYITYNVNGYQYMGGAHGGVFGAGPLTFSLETGQQLTQFLRPDAIERLRPLLLEGIRKHLLEGEPQLQIDQLGDYLMVRPDELPLPVWNPLPTAEGLTFIYQQYEVVPYAAGMPVVTIPYDRLADELTPEARALLLGQP